MPLQLPGPEFQLLAVIITKLGQTAQVSNKKKGGHEVDKYV